MKRTAIGVALLLMALVLPAYAGTGQAGGPKIDPALEAVLATAAPDAQITAIMTLAEQSDVSGLPWASRMVQQQEVVQRLRATAQRTQGPLLAWLAARQAEGHVSNKIPLWVFNGVSVTATPDVLRQLAERPDVRSLTTDGIDVVPADITTNGAPEQNLTVIGAPALWSLGFTGQGVVVANLDTGVDASHPDLGSRWRGGSNSWYDPYGQHPTTPTDLSGHGTWTMGVMVGGDAGGTSVGVAPSARWIAAKIFSDAGTATATAIHQAFQWVLDPDGDPGTPDAPDIVNNSWAFGTPGCNLEFQLDLRSLRAAGILPVFAAGNYGPGGSTSVSPANYPEALAVGATDNSDAILNLSSRGPSACGEASSIYPEVVAPGVNIRTTDLFGGYYSATGTSLSAPHVSGILALLLSAFPNLNSDQQAAALTAGAVDLGLAGPDNTFGAGRIDALASYQWLAAGGAATVPPPTPTPTFTPTATPTRAPTATPTAIPSVHVGDLDRAATASGSGWTAKVTVEVHTLAHSLVSGAKVSGSWSGGVTGTASCTTDATGRCTVSTGTIPKKATSVTFAVSGVTTSGYIYQPSANHDPDGDSNGTTITVSKP